MAKEYYIRQSTQEEKPLKIDWTVSLPGTVTVSSLAYTHTPPSGAAATFSHDVSAAPITWTYSPVGLVVGSHTLDIVATTSNALISPSVRFVIIVPY